MLLNNKRSKLDESKRILPMTIIVLAIIEFSDEPLSINFFMYLIIFSPCFRALLNYISIYLFLSDEF